MLYLEQELGTGKIKSKTTAKLKDRRYCSLCPCCCRFLSFCYEYTGRLLTHCLYWLPSIAGVSEVLNIAGISGAADIPTLAVVSAVASIPTITFADLRSVAAIPVLAILLFRMLGCCFGADPPDVHLLRCLGGHVSGFFYLRVIRKWP